MVKQSLGFRFHAESVILRAFSVAMGKVSIGQVKPAAVRVYLNGRGPVTRFWERKWVALRGFYRFALSRDLARRSPLPARPAKVTKTFAPYIYSRAELQRLLQVRAKERSGRLSPQTVSTLLRLVYGAGLRISEALHLKDGDVDLQVRLLHVRQSKFFKTRLVPVGPRLAKALEEYRAARSQAGSAEGRFFQGQGGKPISRSTAERVFRKRCVAAQVRRMDGSRYQPRLHDLRHTFAVHSLTAGYRAGVDVQALLVKLSAYLGHVNIAATQKYLTITPELRKQASSRFARYALGGSHD
jgi:integrase